VTGEIAVKRNMSQKELRMRLWLGATRAQGWLDIGAVCNGIAWVEVEVEAEVQC
jgi:hypothetical protein